MDAISLFKTTWSGTSCQLLLSWKSWGQVLRFKISLRARLMEVFMLFGHRLSGGGHCFTKSISSSSSQYSRLFERREEKKMYVEGAKEATPPRERRSKLYSNPLRKICHCKNASYSFTLKQNNCTPANSVHILLLGLFIYYLCFTLLLHVCTLWEGWGMPQYMCRKLKDFWSWFSFRIFYLKFFFI